MLIEKTLKSLGLKEKEVSVYLAALELGRASVLQIAKKALLKRPTVYLQLDALIEKGLISTMPEGGKTYYVAEKPAKLLFSLKEKERSLEIILPQLEAKYNLDKNKPQIRFYEGKPAMQRVYDEILESKEIFFYATSIKDYVKEFKDTFKKIIETIRINKIITKEIVSSDPFDQDYAKKYQTEFHQIKVLPKNLNFYADNAIYDNKVAIFSIQDNFFAVVIENKKIADSYRTLFELAWRRAKKMKI